MKEGRPVTQGKEKSVKLASPTNHMSFSFLFPFFFRHFSEGCPVDLPSKPIHFWTIPRVTKSGDQKGRWMHVLICVGGNQVKNDVVSCVWRVQSVSCVFL